MPAEFLHTEGGVLPVQLTMTGTRAETELKCLRYEGSSSDQDCPTGENRSKTVVLFTTVVATEVRFVYL